MTDAAHPNDTDAFHDVPNSVVGPETGANIVDLGLIYRAEVNANGTALRMTMSRACSHMVGGHARARWRR